MKRPRVGMKVRRWDGALGECTMNARDDDHFLRVSGGEITVKWADGTRSREIWLCDIEPVE